MNYELLFDKEWGHDPLHRMGHDDDFGIVRTIRPMPAEFTPVDFESADSHSFHECKEKAALYFNNQSELSSVDVEPFACRPGFEQNNTEDGLCLFSPHHDFGSPLICKSSGNRVLLGILTGHFSEKRNSHEVAYYSIVGRHKEWIKNTLNRIEDQIKLQLNCTWWDECPTYSAKYPADNIE